MPTWPSCTCAARSSSIPATPRRGSCWAARCVDNGQPEEALAAYREGIAVAAKKGDKQAGKEMQVFARRIENALRTAPTLPPEPFAGPRGRSSR